MYSFYRIKLKLERRKENVVYVNGGHVITAMNIQKSSLIMEETLPNKGILEKIYNRREELDLLYNRQQS